MLVEALDLNGKGAYTLYRCTDHHLAAKCAPYHYAGTLDGFH